DTTIFLFISWLPPCSTLFPYTTLFRSGIRMEVGDVVSYYSPAGGGYGDPLDRDPELVLDDVLDGFISSYHARDDYGVVLRETERSEEHTSELQSRENLVCRLLHEKKIN